MLRTSITKAARSTAVLRTFSTSARTMAAGDTGSPPKTGGQGDAFQKRERAQEEMFIRKAEREKLLQLREKIKQQQDHLKQLSDHIDEITKDQGGEHN
ncbi:mitochondrial ATPase inhibitor, IATP-domain-containing protein [Cercophora newfieldiana]|uniref:ATPase inhibitor, mitochondrial n=1 Tax=Cercophora newfieldiana TaxID=92897 RepID=A0AA39YS58_9PEZI|nr:mitochondrial ATPase inhibitor, IATP-domain-containing protein [Cercophora newfieldiana]